MSVNASWPTVKAPPLLVCLTTCEAPPVAEKFVVPAGNVIVLLPQMDAQLSVIVPDVSPAIWSVPTLNVFAPVIVCASLVPTTPLDAPTAVGKVQLSPSVALRLNELFNETVLLLEIPSVAP